MLPTNSSPQEDEDTTSPSARRGLRVAIVSPLTPLSGNLATARRIASLLSLSQSRQTASVGSDGGSGVAAGSCGHDAGRGDTEDSRHGALTSSLSMGRSGEETEVFVESVRIFDCDYASDGSVPNAAGGNRGYETLCCGGRGNACTAADRHSDEDRSAIDVCVVIHALRGLRAFERMLAIEPKPCDTRTSSSGSNSSLSCCSGCCRSVVVVFGGTDVNEATRDATAMAEMTRLMSSLVGAERGRESEGVNVDGGFGGRRVAFVCFSEELRAEAMRCWPALVTVANTFVVPQSVDFSDCERVGGGGGGGAIGLPPVPLFRLPQPPKQESVAGSEGSGLVVVPALRSFFCPLAFLADALSACVATTAMANAAVLPYPLSAAPFPASAGPRQPHRQQHFSFLHLGGVRRVKGQSFALEAFRQVAEAAMMSAAAAANTSDADADDAEDGRRGANVSSSPSHPSHRSISGDNSSVGDVEQCVWLWLVGPMLEPSYATEHVVPYVDAIVDVAAGGGNGDGEDAGGNTLAAPLVIKSLRWTRPPLSHSLLRPHSADSGVSVEAAGQTPSARGNDSKTKKSKTFRVVWVTGLPRALVPWALADGGCGNAEEAEAAAADTSQQQRTHRTVALLSTSESEGQPQAVLEAMAIGAVPVAIRDAPGARPVVLDKAYLLADAAAAVTANDRRCYLADAVITDDASNSTGFMAGSPSALAAVMGRLLAEVADGSEGDMVVGNDASEGSTVWHDRGEGTKGRIAAAKAFAAAFHSRAAEARGYAAVLRAVAGVAPAVESD